MFSFWGTIVALFTKGGGWLLFDWFAWDSLEFIAMFEGAGAILTLVLLVGFVTGVATLLAEAKVFCLTVGS